MGAAASWRGDAALFLVGVLGTASSAPPRRSLSEHCDVHQTVCAVRREGGQETSSPSARQAARPRVALFVVGQQARYYPEWTMRHVLAPAARAGYEVDYYAMLSLQSSAAVGHTAFNAYWYRPVPNPSMANLSTEALTEYVVRHGRHYGARRVIVYTLRSDFDIDELPPELLQRRKPLGSPSANSTTFLRDLHRLKQIELLWNWTLGATPEHGYDQVLLLRDDAFWADHVHLRMFPDPWTVYSRQFGFLCARSPADGPDDKGLVFGGRIAGEMLSLYSAYYHNPSHLLDDMDSLEHFIYLVAQAKNVRWEMVRKDWLPYFTAQHMLHPKWSRPKICLRGITQEQLENPTDVCVHPGQIPYPFCEDLPLL